MIESCRGLPNNASGDRVRVNAAGMASHVSYASLPWQQPTRRKALFGSRIGELEGGEEREGSSVSRAFLLGGVLTLSCPVRHIW